MCGIAGLISTETISSSPELVQKATATLQHRGPAGENFWVNDEGTVVFGHCRLNIIDLSPAAAQPMHYHSRYTLIYNGEIYNYLELRSELQQKGHSFRSHSDTEVLLAAYAEWGSACLQRFDGAFAFALWDQDTQTLFAARDRFGEKPFYFFYDEKRLAFASELKALWQMDIAKEVNHKMVYNFLTIGYTTNPADGTETFYKGVRKLPAAHYLLYILPQNKLQLQHYWQVNIEPDTAISEQGAIEKFQALFTDSIHKRLRSDVAIGTSLSGGLDSSSIVAFCTAQKAAQYTHRCFTAGFPGFEKDESGYASLVAKQFRLEHYTTTVTPIEAVALMDKVAAQQDEPFSSASVLAQYKVFQLAKEHGVTVVLDGQGADEILGGYHKYYSWYWRELYRAGKLEQSGELQAARSLGINPPFGLKSKMAALLPEFSMAMLQTQRSKQAFKHRALSRDFAFANKQNFYYATPTSLTLNGALFYNTFVNGLEELLRLADRNSMAHSIEARLPFLQHQLVEFLFTLPPHFKIHQGWTKWLLRKSVETKLPPEIVWRKDKTGFEPPQKLWMHNNSVREKITAGKKVLVKQGVLQPSVLTQKIIPGNAHEAHSFDWRYWSAAQLFL